MEKFKVYKVVITINHNKSSKYVFKQMQFVYPSIDTILELTEKALTADSPYRAVASTVTDIHTQIIEHEFEFTDGSEL